MPSNLTRSASHGSRLPHSASPRPRRVWLITTLVVLAFAAMPASAQTTGMSLSILGGFGGSPDSDNYTSATLQAVVSWEWRLHTFAQARVGQLDLDLESSLAGIQQSATLSWIGLSTEYQYDSDFYDSGYVIGIGYYKLESDPVFIPGVAFLPANDEDAIGLHAGVSGHFDLSPHWSVPVEILGHFANFDQAQIFLTVHAGLRYRF